MENKEPYVISGINPVVNFISERSKQWLYIISKDYHISLVKSNNRYEIALFYKDTLSDRYTDEWGDSVLRLTSWEELEHWINKIKGDIS